MTGWLIRRFVRDAGNTTDPGVRYTYGKLAGTTGVACNILLFIAKVLIGWLSGSLAIVADSFNNLSDAGSSVVTLIGFRMSSAPADQEHPFGHGRVEYLSALAVAALIMVAGFELASSAVNKILHPTFSEFSWVTLVVLVLAILVKLWMAMFYRKIGKRIHSEVLTASSADSRNDVICTGVILVSSLFCMLTGYDIDGYIGAAVALFVMWSGFSVMRTTISPLLGEMPDPQLVKSIRQTVLGKKGILGIHDMIIHNYGPGRCIVSLHAEVPADVSILRSHEIIDEVEQELLQQFNIVSCIHMDPVVTNDDRVDTLKQLTETVLKDMDDRLSLHDFRVVFGEQRTNLIFDVEVPFGYKGEDTLRANLQQRVHKLDPHLVVVASVEHSYT